MNKFSHKKPVIFKDNNICNQYNNKINKNIHVCNNYKLTIRNDNKANYIYNIHNIKEIKPIILTQNIHNKNYYIINKIKKLLNYIIKVSKTHSHLIILWLTIKNIIDSINHNSYTFNNDLNDIILVLKNI